MQYKLLWSCEKRKANNMNLVNFSILLPGNIFLTAVWFEFLGAEWVPLPIHSKYSSLPPESPHCLSIPLPLAPSPWEPQVCSPWPLLFTALQFTTINWKKKKNHHRFLPFDPSQVCLSGNKTSGPGGQPIPCENCHIWLSWEGRREGAAPYAKKPDSVLTEILERYYE